jgi:lysophospholipase L1-like esterase
VRRAFVPLASTLENTRFMRALLGIVMPSLLLVACSSASGGGTTTPAAGDGGIDDAAAPLVVEYLGLGDSIAYGQNSWIPYTKEARPDDKAFIGYPMLVGAELFGGRFLDLGCPGETTASFYDATVRDNGCRAYKTDNAQAMHVQYASTQAEKMREVLAAHPEVKAITFSLGGNDLLMTLADCAKEAGSGDAALACATQRIPQVLTAGKENLGQIFSSLRESGFTGDIVYVNQYSNNLPGSQQTTAINLWNLSIADVGAASNVKVADVFSAMAKAAESAGGDPCAAGLLIPNPVQPVPEGQAKCDVHTSAAGTRVLADTVAAVLAKP